MFIEKPCFLHIYPNIVISPSNIQSYVQYLPYIKFLNYLKTNAKIGLIHLFYATARLAIVI